MKKRKLLKKVSDFMDLGKRKQCARKDKLKGILKQLSAKEKKLLKKIEDERDNDKKKRLCKEAEIVHAQRLKGLKHLKELRCD
jgi:hypothetical protein